MRQLQPNSHLSEYSLPSREAVRAEAELHREWGAFGGIAVTIARLFGSDRDRAAGPRYLDVQFEARHARSEDGSAAKGRIEVRPRPDDIVAQWAAGGYAGISLSDSAYPSYAFLRECRGLVTLYAERSAFKDSDGQALRAMSELKTCYFDGSKITSLGFLSGLQLERVSFSGTQVHSLEPLREHQQLTLVGASGSKVSDLAPLANKQSLESVMIDGSAVTDLTPLLTCERLRVLFVSPAQLQAKGMTELKERFTNLTVEVVP